MCGTHVSRSISTTHRWVAFDHVGNRVGRKRTVASSPADSSGGSRSANRYAAAATSFSVTDLVGVPLTNTVPASMSRSSGAASSEWAATASTFSRTASVASLAAPPATTAVRLPPVPGPYGVDCVSAWTTVTSS